MTITRFVASCATDNTYALAEGPLWDPEQKRIWWVDIHGGDVHRGELVGHRIEVDASFHVDDTVGAVATASDGGLLVAASKSLVHVTNSRQTHVAELVPEAERRRLNDAKVDPAGRLLVGTLSLGATGSESLYRVGGDGRVETLDDDLQMSNGIGWSPDQRTMYTVDTGGHRVWQRDYDPPSGRHGPRRPFLSIADGFPDGLCVDLTGTVWVAVWGQGQVRAFTPDGTQSAVVHVDAPYVSCPTFGGRNLDVLIVTTAIDDLGDQARQQNPQSGALFIADVGVAGLPTTPWAGPVVAPTHPTPSKEHRQ